ncbi:hypothetical protein [Amycolatopsis plumensis]
MALPVDERVLLCVAPKIAAHSVTRTTPGMTGRTSDDVRVDGRPGG